MSITGAPNTRGLLKYLHNSNDLGDSRASLGSAKVPSRARPGTPARPMAAVSVNGVPSRACVLKYLHNSNDLGDFLAAPGSAGEPSRARPGSPGPAKGRCIN